MQQKNNKIELPSNQYSLQYSNSETADYNTETGTNPETQFVEITDSTDLSLAKTLRVVTNNYTLTNNKQLVLEYEMDVPSSDGMVGAVSAVKYNSVIPFFDNYSRIQNEYKNIRFAGFYLQNILLDNKITNCILYIDNCIRKW